MTAGLDVLPCPADWRPLDHAPLSGRDVVCVSVMDWDWPFWTSRQHLMAQLARRNRVLFVDPPATFASDYLGARSDPRRGCKLTRWARAGGLRAVPEGLTVWTPPPAIPFNRIRQRPLFERLLACNQGLFRQALRRTLHRLEFADPILWVSFNVYFGDAVVGRLGEALSVYHCTDEIAGFPGYSPLIKEIEARMAARCNLVVATSEVLRDHKRAYNPHTHFIPNAADVELFEETLASPGPEPDDLRRLPHPRAGFVGQIEYRFGGELLSDVAQRLPGWSFALIGPVQAGHREVEELRRLPNVHFLGLKPRAALPGYLAGLDVALIPYKLTLLTESIYPLKVHEYLAAGRPVVATPIPSLLAMADRVALAADGPAFAAAIEQAAAEDSPARREARRRQARGESWEARTAQISDLLADALPPRAAVAPTPAACPGSDAAPERAASSTPLSWTSFLRLGTELAGRHANPAKRLIYRLLGDINLHRRIRAAHVAALLRAEEMHGAQVLDAGCGEGAVSFALARELTGSHVTGVDVDPTCVEACRSVAARLSHQNVDFEVADVTRLPYRERFELATCVELLEHLPNDGAALRSLYRALKPGGCLLVHVPMRHQQQRRILPTHARHAVPGHVRDEYVEAEIVDRVEGAGFEVGAVTTTFGPVGELAFELNTLSLGGRLRAPLAALTYPLALLLGYLEVSAGPGAGGNSFLIVARKPGPPSVMRSA